jgi:hypothetical protein
MPYRLEIDPRNPQHPYLMEDDSGEDKLTVLFELLRFHIVRSNDHSRETERVLNEIGTEARQGELW